MTRYRLPDVLGGGEHEATGGELEFQVRFDLGLTAPIWLYRKDLTEVPPPVPAEPEPGAYLIGGALAMRFAAPAGYTCWYYGRRGGGSDVDSPGFGETDAWETVWYDLGGPDVAIVPLIPAPSDVELPWTLAGDGDERPWQVGVECARNGRVFVNATVNRRGAAVGLFPDRAEEMAAALLTGAKAARAVAS